LIDVYFGYSPNVFKVTIALGEMGLDYRTIPIDVTKGEHLSSDFLSISPNNKIPVIVDHEPVGGGAPITLFESGAILIYLAEKTGQFISDSPPTRSETIQWVMWQMAGFGPILGQVHYFSKYASEQVPHAISRYSTEASRLYSVLDLRLADSAYVAGDNYSIADMSIWPWVYYHDLHDIDIIHYPNVERWFNGIGLRPAVAKAMDGLEVQAYPLSQEARKILYKDLA